MPRKEQVAGPNLVYVYGETILANQTGTRELRDHQGNPVKAGEFYEVTPEAIKRI